MDQSQVVPAIGADVTALMPKVGEDVTALMGGAPPPVPAAVVRPPADTRSIWEKALDAVVGVSDTVIPTGLRIGGAVAGGLVGSFGGPVGTVAGGAAGSGLGETAAELYEQARGVREDLNPWQIATQTGLGAIPVVGKAGATVARNVIGRGVQGGVMGGVSSAATDLAEGRTPTVGGVATGAGLGVALGAGAGRLESAALARRAAPAVGEDVTDLIAPVATPAPKPRISAEEFVRLKAEKEAALQADTVVPPQAPVVETPHTPPPVRKIQQAAKLAGEPIPAQKPLDADRINGEEKFLETQPEPFREGISQIFESNRHFEAQRRGVQPVERTNEIARWIQVERQKLLPKGTSLNAEELTAYKNNVATSMDQTTELSAKVRAGEATDIDKAKLLHSVQQSVTLLANAMGARAEAGRALNALKGMAQVLETRDIAAYEQLIKEAKRAGLDPTELATKFAELKDPVAQMQYLRSLNQAGVMDWAKGVFFSNILSGPRTHLRNVLGNTTNAVFRAASHTAAYGYDVGRAALTGKSREIFSGEVGERLAGAAVGFKQGLDDAMFTLEQGFTRSDLGTFDVRRKELQGGGKNPFNWTGRALEAMDQFFYSVNYNSELFARLYAKGRKQGLTGKALTDQIADWKLAPPKDVAAEANREALRAVYKETGGKVIEGITTLKTKAPILDFVVPFVRTPGNILRQGVEATPLAFLTAQTREAMKAGGRESAEAIGRVVTGTTALAGIAWWAGAGRLSGTGPSDPEQRAALMENGWKPNAIKVGDKWITFSDLVQPLAQPLFAVANAYELYRNGEQVDPLQVMASAGGSLLDQSFLAGVSDLNRALSDPDRFADQFFQRWVQSAVPFSGAARNVTQAIDPVVREPKNLVESVKSIVPGLSTDVDPKIGRLGQTIERDGGPLLRGLSPSNVGFESKDSVIKELSRLKIDSIGLPPKKLQASGRNPAIELTIEQRQQIGKATHQALEKLFARPGFRSLDEDRARELIGQEIQQARSRVTQQIRQRQAQRDRR